MPEQRVLPVLAARKQPRLPPPRRAWCRSWIPSCRPQDKAPGPVAPSPGRQAHPAKECDFRRRQRRWHPSTCRCRGLHPATRGRIGGGWSLSVLSAPHGTGQAPASKRSFGRRPAGVRPWRSSCPQAAPARHRGHRPMLHEVQCRQVRRLGATPPRSADAGRVRPDSWFCPSGARSWRHGACSCLSPPRRAGSDFPRVTTVLAGVICRRTEGVAVELANDFLG